MSLRLTPVRACACHVRVPCVLARAWAHVRRAHQHGDRKFPAASLSMCVATLELDMLLRHRQFQPSAQPSANPFR